MAAAVTLGIWLARPLPGWWAAVGLVVVAARGAWHPPRAALLLAALAVLGAGLSARAWAGARPVARAPLAGTATLLTDPVPAGRGVRVTVRVDGAHYELTGYGAAGRTLSRHLAGERVAVVGEVRPATGGWARRLAARHLVGRLDADHLGDWSEGSRVAAAANRARRLLAGGVAGMPQLDRALFLGLVIGDDRDEPDWLVDDFRAAGLSHLTAVSGQNVALTVLAAGPLLRRLRPAPRWAATVTLVGWFALLTRFEPSVLRASGMAALAATAFWRGWRVSPVRLLALTVGGFELVDPLLVWSVGWWLSVSATGALAVLARPLADRLPGPRWLRDPLGATIAAQLGVAPVSLLVFGRVSVLALPANLLAVPVAGFVMAWGIPAGVLAGALRTMPAVTGLVNLPSFLATRWVRVVAELVAGLEPGWSGAWVLALQAAPVVVLLVITGRMRRGAAADPGG